MKFQDVAILRGNLVFLEDETVLFYDLFEGTVNIVEVGFVWLEKREWLIVILN